MHRIFVRALDLSGTSPAERRATFWTAACFFCVLAGYYMLRPLREQIGVAYGVRSLPWLYDLTLVTVLLFNPLYWLLANRLPSRRFVPAAFHFFAANMVAFCVLFMALPETAQTVNRGAGAAYWAWLSTFNVFAVSLVWIHAVEHFSVVRGKRLFGLIGVGGTLGAVCGSGATGLLMDGGVLDAVYLPLLAAVILEVGFLCYLVSVRACRAMTGGPEATASAQPEIAAGGVFRGLALLFRSSYLAGICVYMLMLSLVATAIYFRRNEIVEASVEGRQEQTGLFAWMDFCGQTLVLTVQLFFTGRILRISGLALALCVLPMVSATGLLFLGLLPSLAVIFALEVARRGVQFSVDKPAREVLYTPLGLEEKFKFKTLADTFVFRLGDSLGAKLQAALRAQGLTLGQLTWVTVPLALLWAVTGWLLGRRNRRVVEASAGSGQEGKAGSTGADQPAPIS